ncbi:MAG: DNA repair protein RadA [Candidatus Pacebacteria bacterium]|nr:DNA repair protein RadA [Candidatus Paceibacterota bacterium]PIR60911.1 MAG: DNA repair protein RadA [Candidatus Pacebacteria bacterium CG10_big_fil_rev_8_21_14_0_10_44_54]
MARAETVFVCQECGWQNARWQGQCAQCRAWNSLVEELITQPISAGKKASSAISSLTLPEVERLSRSFSRFSSGFDELDRVLGGSGSDVGIVQGAVMLVSGEPGIGKSTVLTQIGLSMKVSTKSSRKEPLVAYLCGEENPEQILLRIKRLQNSGTKKNSKQKVIPPSWHFFTTQSIDAALQALNKLKPDLVVVDSVQSFRSEELSGAVGSVGQVRAVTTAVTAWAKQQTTPVFIVGHVTKEGGIAGPKVLEHIVDVVLDISGERTSDLRLIRTYKNRFGASDEVGVFRMAEEGFVEVPNPSDVLVQQGTNNTPGSVLAGILEGTRPLLIELQALAVASNLAMPRRVGRGVSLSRIQVLAAVLEKHCRLPVSKYDVFLSVAGGIVVREPAIDLGFAVAIASSLAGKPIPRSYAFIGEVGLLGEVRSVPYADSRAKSAQRLGVERIFSHQSHSSVAEVLKELQIRK